MAMVYMHQNYVKRHEGHEKMASGLLERITSVDGRLSGLAGTVNTNAEVTKEMVKRIEGSLKALADGQDRIERRLDQAIKDDKDGRH